MTANALRSGATFRKPTIAISGSYVASPFPRATCSSFLVTERASAKNFYRIFMSVSVQMAATERSAGRRKRRVQPGTRIVTASRDKTARIWNAARLVLVSRAELIRRTCETTLANGLSKFSGSELDAAPVLDPQLDTDPCHPPSFWARVAAIFAAALSR